MAEKQIGDFTVSVSQPYPSWCEVKTPTGDYIRLRHDELRDLQYAVEWMLRHASNIINSPL